MVLTPIAGTIAHCDGLPYTLLIDRRQADGRSEDAWSMSKNQGANNGECLS
jgi:hypothetical protein